jgi:hypothetical protein
MVLLYLARKPQVSRKIASWLLIFFEYDFSIIYKPRKSHSVVDILSRMPNLTKESGIPDQTMTATLSFYNQYGYRKILSISLPKNFRFITTRSKRKSLPSEL